MTEREKRITVRVSEGLHRKVKAKAALIGRSVSDVVREYLEEWIEEPLPEEPQGEVTHPGSGALRGPEGADHRVL